MNLIISLRVFFESILMETNLPTNFKEIRQLQIEIIQTRK